LRQIKQRISVNYHIPPLDKEEIKAYIDFRLEQVGAFNLKFINGAIERIYEFSGGIPRLINIICDRALLAGFTKGRTAIDTNLVNTCIKELH